MQKTLGDMLKGGNMTPGGGIGGGAQRPQFQPRTLKDWQKIVGTIGDALQVAGGGRGTFLPAVMEDRQRNEAMMQQYDLAERQAEQQRANKKWEWQNKPDEPTADMRNFEWYESATPQQRALYDQFKPVITSTWQGPQAVPRSSLGPPTAPVGKLTPITPTMQNTPAPQMNASGNPTFLTPDQYRVTVDALGQARTDDWMRRNNIRIGGQ